MRRCIVCDERTTGLKKELMCANCYNAKLVIQRSVQAMMRIHGVPLASGVCVACEVKVATCRDHRHYSKPLQVDNVCVTCNKSRGFALDLFELIMQHRGMREIDKENTAIMDVDHIPPVVQINSIDTTYSGYKIPLHEMMEATERNEIIEALETTRWNRTKAAKLLGMTFRAIRYRIDKYGIEI